jgi:hypothetical protein
MFSRLKRPSTLAKEVSVQDSYIKCKSQLSNIRNKDDSIMKSTDYSMINVGLTKGRENMKVSDFLAE